MVLFRHAQIQSAGISSDRGLPAPPVRIWFSMCRISESKRWQLLLELVAADIRLCAMKPRTREAKKSLFQQAPLVKNSLRLALWVCGTAAGIGLAENLLPNPKFDEVANQPAGWQLVGSTGQRLPNAHENRSALMVKGNGKSQTFWRTEPITLKPNSLYRFNFFGRWERANPEGGALAGPSTINRDFLLTETWARYSYVFSAPSSDAPKDFVRLGEWHVSGSVYFADAALSPVSATFRRIAPGIELGESESVQGGTYRFKPNFKGIGANYHRPLNVNRAAFNTDRWVFYSGSEVIYRLGVKGGGQARAKVDTSLNYHASGSLHVDASRDRTNWVSLAMCDGQRRSASVELPADLFPSDELFVRLSCRGTNSSLQVNAFEYESRLTKPPPDGEGLTTFADIAPGASEK